MMIPVFKLSTKMSLLAAVSCMSLLSVVVPSSRVLAEEVDFSSAVVTPVSVSPDQMVHGAQAFIEQVSRRGIGFLSNPEMDLTEQRQAFRSLLRDAFDLETIGRFALGRYWRVATATERVEYQRLFEKMVVDVYAERFSAYDGQQLKVTGAKIVGDTDVVVSSLIVPKDGGEKVKVDWRVRKSTARYRVVDVMVEGVSMGVTQRSDFSSVIQRGGGTMDALLKHLRSGLKSK